MSMLPPLKCFACVAQPGAADLGAPGFVHKADIICGKKAVHTTITVRTNPIQPHAWHDTCLTPPFMLLK
jgi:hypothetical protein